MKLVLIKDPKPKKSILVIGFPGTGLVGSISLSFLSEKKDFELIGFIKSPHLAPIVAVHNYKVLPPARVYYSKSLSMFLIFSEIFVPASISDEFADIIFEFAESHNVKQIISLGGIALRKRSDVVYALCNNERLLSKLEKMGFEKIKECATTGVIGSVLARSPFKKYDILALLAEANPDFIDPKAASLALKKLSQLLSIKITTSELDEDADKLKKISKSLAKQSKNDSMYG